MQQNSYSKTFTADIASNRIERVFRILTMVVFANSLLRGIRTPGRWAATHLLFNYDYGFTKRSFLGSLVGALHLPSLYHYPFFFWFAVVIFMADTLLLMTLLANIVHVDNTTTKLVALLFSSSLSPVFFAHTIGYFDDLTLLVTLVALMIERFYLRSFFVGAFFFTSLFVHEAGCLLFFPLVFLRFGVDLVSRFRWQRLTTLAGLTLCLAFADVILGRSHLDPTSAEAMYHALQLKADYHLRHDAFQVLTRNIEDNWRVTTELWRDAEFREYFFSSLWVTLPTVFYLLWISWIAVPTSRYSGILRLLVASASLAPLSLHLLGWDFARWDTLAITTSFLAFVIVKLYLPPPSNTERDASFRHSLIVPAILIVLNLSSTIVLFDGYSVQTFPYGKHFNDIINIVTGRAPFPPRPETCFPEEPQCP